MVSAKKDERPPEMTLAAEAADRKERLLALRRRKDDGAEEDGTRYVLGCLLFPLTYQYTPSSPRPGQQPLLCLPTTKL